MSKTIVFLFLLITLYANTLFAQVINLNKGTILQKSYLEIISYQNIKGKLFPFLYCICRKSHYINTPEIVLHEESAGFFECFVVDGIIGSNMLKNL